MIAAGNTMLLTNTQMLKKEARYSIDKNSSNERGLWLLVSNKMLVSIIATIFSILRNPMRSKLDAWLF